MGAFVLLPLGNGTLGASNQVSYTARQGFKVHALMYTFTTSAVVGVRSPFIDVETPGGAAIIYRINLATQAEGITATYRLSEQAALGGLNQTQLPAPIFVGKDSVFNMEIASVDPGDRMTAISLLVEYDD